MKQTVEPEAKAHANVIDGLQSIIELQSQEIERYQRPVHKLSIFWLGCLLGLVIAAIAFTIVRS